MKNIPVTIIVSCTGKGKKHEYILDINIESNTSYIDDISEEVEQLVPLSAELEPIIDLSDSYSIDRIIVHAHSIEYFCSECGCKVNADVYEECIGMCEDCYTNSEEFNEDLED